MTTLLVLLAIVLMGCCAFGVEKVKGVHLGWLGATLYVATGLIASIS